MKALHFHLYIRTKNIFTIALAECAHHSNRLLSKAYILVHVCEMKITHMMYYHFHYMVVFSALCNAKQSKQKSFANTKETVFINLTWNGCLFFLFFLLFLLKQIDKLFF